MQAKCGELLATFLRPKAHRLLLTADRYCADDGV